MPIHNWKRFRGTTSIELNRALRFLKYFDAGRAETTLNI
jgi:hypothetical protein